MDDRFENGRIPVNEAPLNRDELTFMVCGFVAYPTVYRSALNIGFNASLLNGSDEYALSIFMSVYETLRKEHGGVSKIMFTTYLNGMINSGVRPMPAHIRDQIIGHEGFAHIAFDGPPPNPDDARRQRSYVQDILRRFLNARLINAELKNMLMASDENAAPVQIDSMLERFRRKAQAVKFVGQEAENAAVMPDIGSQIILPPVATPTTISWIDNYIGGFRAGDVIGLLGPYAGGKTTMLSTIGVRLARQYAATGENKIAVYICYEDGAAKMNWSFYSAAAHIHRDRFKNKVDSADFWAGLSTRDNVFPYERQLAANRNGEIILSETDRWNAAKPWLNNHFAFLDFSATAEANYRGNGGILEVVAALENLTENLGMEIGVVLLDYMSLMINRQLAQNASTRHAEQIWRQIQQFPDELKTHISMPFNTTVVVAHQLAQGDIKNIPSFRYVSHADAQGSKAFGENVHACLCLNKPDPETGVSTIHWSKIRFDRPACGPYGLVKIDESVVDVWLADDEYYINDVSRKIMKKNEAAAVASPEVMSSSQRPRRIMRPDGAVPAMPDIDADFLS
jgi:hypothetical protein